MGGGGFSAPPGDPALDLYVLQVARTPHPRICLLPTAGGDAEEQIRRFYSAFRHLPCEPTHVSLFRLGSDRVDLREVLLSQDVLYVGGGSLLNLLAVWRAHGADRLLREAWEQGIVLCGISAGSMCWFEAGLTTSFGEPRPVRALGFLRGSNSVHHDSERERRPVLPPGDPQRVRAAGLRGRRRRRPAVRGHRAGGGGQRPAGRRRLLGRGGRRRGGRDAARDGRAAGPRGARSRPRRCRSPSCARRAPAASAAATRGAAAADPQRCGNAKRRRQGAASRGEVGGPLGGGDAYAPACDTRPRRRERRRPRRGEWVPALSICARRSSSRATSSAVGSNGSAIGAARAERQRREDARVGLRDQRGPARRAGAVECRKPLQRDLVA